MPERKQIVINTGPLLALAAALDRFSLLNDLYAAVHVPYEVGAEIAAGGSSGFAADLLESESWLCIGTTPTPAIPPLLSNSLDAGEAAVIHYAVTHGIETVAIDEATGRRMARLSGLHLTGSLGILLRAKEKGHPLLLSHAITRMRSKGIWLSDDLVRLVLQQAGEA
jgi:predicted nucleic acid-binding protein